MPELPEVETIARSLRDGGREAPGITGETIARADLRWKRTLAVPSAAAFRKRVTGQRIRNVGRRGKFIVIELSKDYLLIHLRMSGDLVVGRGKDALGSHPRLVLYMKDGLHLSFTDARKFGRVWLVDDLQSVFGALGPEPLDPALTAKRFHAALSARRRQLKPLLLDQNFIAGIGNIYADEALHLAKMHPARLSSSFTFTEARTLLNAIRAVLKQGIRRNGSSIDWVYRGGNFQHEFRVYQRTGEACPECGTPIQRMMMGQRSTHYCPKCQPLKRRRA